MNRLYRAAGRIGYFIIWPVLFVYLRIGVRTRVLILAQQQVLLVRGWLDDGSWGLPGGGLHRHEAPTIGALREVFEETGLHLPAKQLRYLRAEEVRWRGLKAYCHFFVIELGDQPPLQAQRGEIADAAWISLNDVGQLRCKPEIRRALQLLAHP